MTDIRETIARAIADSICGGHVQWTDLGGRVRESYMGSASAVLSAIEAAGWVVVPADLPDDRAEAMEDVVAAAIRGDARLGFRCGCGECDEQAWGWMRKVWAAGVGAAAPPLTPEAGKE